MVSMIYKVIKGRLIPYHSELDRTDAHKYATSSTSNGDVTVYLKEHQVFFIVRIFTQRLCILSENPGETLEATYYLKQCGFNL